MTHEGPATVDLAALWRREPTLVSLARRVLAGRDGAEDAVHDACLAALDAPAEGLGPVGRFVERVARARKQREARRARLERGTPSREAETPEPAARAVERADTRRVVLEEVLALEPVSRDVLVLRFLEERSVEEVAAALGVPTATVRTRVHRALPKLRERLARRLGRGHDGWLAAVAPLASLGERSVETHSMAVAGVGAAGAASVAAVAARGGRLGAWASWARVALVSALVAVAGVAWRALNAPSTSLDTHADSSLAALPGDPSPAVRAPDQGASRASGRRVAATEVDSADISRAPADRAEESDERTVTLPLDASLAIEVVDARTGLPVAGSNVTVGLAEDEPRLTAEGWIEHEPATAATDALGRVTLAVPSEARLAVSVEAPSGAHFVAVKVEDGRLALRALFGPARLARGSRLVLAPGERRAVRADVDTRPALRIAVVDEGGALVTDARGALERALSSDPWASPEPHVASAPLAFGVPSEAPGVLEFFAGDVALEGTLLVEASTQLEGLDVTRRAMTTLDAGRAAASQVEPIVMRLQPQAKIRGEFVQMRGHLAIPVARDPLVRRSGVYRELASLRCRVDLWGGFETAPLPPGSYDLVVVPNSGDFGGLPRVWTVGPVEAGATGIRIERPSTPVGSLRVELRGAVDLDGASLHLVRASRVPYALPRIGQGEVRVVQDPAGPTPRDARWARELEFTTLPDGAVIAAQRFALEAGVRELTHVEPGPALVVVMPRRGRAAPFRAASSRWLELPAGAATLVLELEPAASVSGRVHGAPLDGDWHVAAATPSGTRLHVESDEGRRRIAPLGASGRFLLSDLPTGDVELRFGPRDELDAGRAARVARVRLHAGTNAPVEVRA